ncbi:MAG: hypothetical protein ABIF88_03025, partial [archaeon]
SSDDSVSVGDFGSQVFFAKGSYGIHALGISRFDSGTLSPFIDGYFPGAAPYQHVSSSRDSNVHVYNYQKPEGVNIWYGKLIRFDSTNGKIWEWTTPYTFLGTFMKSFVSDSGEKIVVIAYDYVATKNRIHVFEGNSNVPIYESELPMFMNLKGGILSGDGEVVIMHSDATLSIYNVDTHVEMLSEYTFNGLSCIFTPYDIASDSNTLVSGCGNTKGISVYKRNGANGLNKVWTYYDDDFTSVMDVKVSEDGERLIALVSKSTSGLKFLEIDLVAQKVIYEKELDYGNYALDITEDGNYYALEFNGQGGTVPEVQVFRFRTSSTEKTPVSKYYTNGEVYNMEFTPQGDALVINYKSGSGGKFAVLEPFPLGVRMEGIPKIGSMVTFVQPWFSGLINKVVYSNSLNPMEIPPWGWLYPNRNTLYILPSGTNVVDKTLTNYVIPNNPALVGTNLYFQGVGFNPRDLSDNYIGFTILPA